jgi:hypothetical protein
MLPVLDLDPVFRATSGLFKLTRLNRGGAMLVADQDA